MFELLAILIGASIVFFSIRAPQGRWQRALVSCVTGAAVFVYHLQTARSWTWVPEPAKSYVLKGVPAPRVLDLVGVVIGAFCLYVALGPAATAYRFLTHDDKFASRRRWRALCDVGVWVGYVCLLWFCTTKAQAVLYVVVLWASHLGYARFDVILARSDPNSNHRSDSLDERDGVPNALSDEALNR